jgi:hypothetical protein
MLSFLDFYGVVHYEFVPQGQTMNQDHYIGTLRRLWVNVKQNLLEK